MNYIPVLKCQGCNNTFKINELCETIHLFANGSIHIRGECPFCRGYVKYVPYRDSKHVHNILKYFYNGDLKSLDLLRKTAIYNGIEKEIQ
jgi:hypothetical protein